MLKLFKYEKLAKSNEASSRKWPKTSFFDIKFPIKILWVSLEKSIFVTFLHLDQAIFLQKIRKNLWREVQTDTLTNKTGWIHRTGGQVKKYKGIFWPKEHGKNSFEEKYCKKYSALCACANRHISYFSGFPNHKIGTKNSLFYLEQGIFSYFWLKCSLAARPSHSFIYFPFCKN